MKYVTRSVFMGNSSWRDRGGRLVGIGADFFGDAVLSAAGAAADGGGIPIVVMDGSGGIGGKLLYDPSYLFQYCSTNFW